MCGIGFINLAPGSTLDVRLVSRMLLHDLASRGRDAAGVAWKRDDGRTLYRKLPGHPVKMAAYLSKVSGSRSLDGAQSVLVHTRFGTVGDPEHPENNHPIIRPGVAMVHNGSIRNTEYLYRRAKSPQMAVVDSDALAALIETAPSQRALDGRFKAVKGLASLAWLEVDNDPETVDELRAARIDTRPLIVASTNDGDLIGASTMATIVKTAAHAGVGIARMFELPEGAVIHAKGGTITEARQIGTGSGRAESTAEYAGDSKVGKGKRRRTPNQNEKRRHQPEPMW